MFSAARIFLPVTLSVLVAIYNYYKSSQKSEFSKGVEVPLNPTSVPSPAPSDLEREILDWIRTLDPAVLNRIRNPDPALLHEIQQFNPAVEIRSFDPSIVDRIRNFDPAFPLEFSESVDVPQNPPSVPSAEPSVVEILSCIGTLGPAVLDEIQQFDPAFLDEDRSFDPSIVDGIRQLSLKGKEEKAEEEEKEREREKSESSSSGGGGGSGGGNENGGEVEKKVVEESSRRNQYPLRPEAGDCSYYLKTGNCKFGSNCKFNHPRTRKNKQVPKARVEGMDELAENPSQTECKYYLRSGGCDYGENCRYSHSREKPSVAPVLELNFLGLPIRPGKRECLYYMRNGSCKYASNCRFNHPDPTATGGSDPPSGYGNGGPASLQGASQSTVAPWSAPRPMNEAPVYSTLMIPPPQVVSSQSSEWNGYRAPAYIPERSMPARPPYMMNNSVAETNVYKPYPHQNQVEEFPERPGQPLCGHFLITGDCKFKSNCKYDHPKTHTAVAHPNHTQ